MVYKTDSLSAGASFRSLVSDAIALVGFFVRFKEGILIGEREIPPDRVWLHRFSKVADSYQMGEEYFNDGQLF